MVQALHNKVAKKWDKHALTCNRYSEQDSVLQSSHQSTSSGTHSVETIDDPYIG